MFAQKRFFNNSFSCPLCRKRWKKWASVVRLLYKPLRRLLVVVYGGFWALWRDKASVCTCSSSVRHPGMWYKACSFHMSAPVSALHWWGPHRRWNSAPGLLFLFNLLTFPRWFVALFGLFTWKLLSSWAFSVGNHHSSGLSDQHQGSRTG